MKLKRYVNGAWVIVDKELKQLTTATDSAASPITIIAPLAEPFDNYRVYGSSSGVGDETENLWDGQSTSLTERQVASGGARRLTFTITEPGIYTVKCFDDRSGYVYCRRYVTSTGNYGTLYRLSVPEEGPESPQTATLEVDSDVILIIYQRDSGTVDETITQFNLAKLCAVPGSTAPATYIPYGYKIPLNVTYPNLFDKNATDTSNGYVANRRIVASKGADYANTDNFISEYISVIPNTVYTLDGIEVVAGSSVAPPGVCYYDANHVFLSGDACRRPSGKWLFSNYQITTPANAAYIRINVSYDTADTAMLTRTDTAPSAYIPHDITTPVYIGSSKLYAEEHLDYESGKVYKRTENDFPYAEAGVYGFSEGTATVASDGAGSFVLQGVIPYGAESEKIPLKSDYIVPLPVSRGGTYTFYVGNVKKDFVSIVFYDVTGNELVSYQGNTVWRTVKDYPITGTIHSVVFRNSRTGGISITTRNVYSPMFSEIGDLGSYVPYLAPTDPPVPFPSVQHYEGESTTSVDTTVAPDKLELTYQGWRVAANSEPKFYHNGQWMTEYRRVEYLKSTGTQIIITDIIGSSENRYELDTQFGSANSSSNRSFFGTIELDSGNLVSRLNLNWGSSSDTIYYAYFFESSNASQKVFDSATYRTTRNTLVASSSIASYGSVSWIPPAVTLGSLTLPLAIFGVLEGSSVSDLKPFAQSDMWVYGLVIKGTDGIITHNLIPVERQIDGALGLYDTITDTFYTNSGTGTFVKGGYI